MIRGAVVLIAALTISSAASAQQMRVERETVLGRFGAVVDTDIPVAPARNGPGVVFTEMVRHPGAESVRLRFQVKERGDAGIWTVAVTAENGRRWEYAPADDETEFWSDEMPGDTVTVNLVSTAVKPVVKLTIDRTAGATQPTVPKSLTEPDEREKWPGVQEPLKTLGRSVVRLRFVDDVKKKVFVCTGWLLFNSRHVLTNDHCINTAAEMRSALADVDFNESVPLRTIRFRRLLMTDARLDFSLLELEQPLDRPALSVGGAVSANQQLAIIQHPAGEPKQLSERGCTVALASVAGVTRDRTDFEHRCDTLGGSSGSPVFDRASLSVVGLHHLGFLEGDKPVNRAVHIAEVLSAIRARFPNIGRSGTN